MEGNQAHDCEELENKSQNLFKVDKQQADSKSEELDSTQNSTTTDEEKVLKKPDKILQCPRCNSLDTKFCYFNNYNVNQPRHFCKNCQRYWTAGGTMRNVPIGAGRRKHKHLASQFRQIIVSADGIPMTRLEAIDSDNQSVISGLQRPAFTSSAANGTVLKFGPQPPALCESMETMLHLKEQKRWIDVGSVDCAETSEEASICGSSLTTAGTQGTELPVRVMQGEQVVPNELITPRSLQCYPVPPLILPLNPCWNGSASMAKAHHPSEGEVDPNSNPNSVRWYPMPVVTVPGICAPNMPLQFLPASCWGSMPVWPAGTGAISPGSNFCLSPTSSTSNSCGSANGSPTLGKHCRDTNFIEDKSDKCVLVPKTLRIDDPNEASRSPIWATLGIKPN